MNNNHKATCDMHHSSWTYNALFPYWTTSNIQIQKTFL